MSVQTQLQLPYFEIKEVVNRQYLRDNFKQTGRASYYIQFSKIKIRENFNKRIVYDGIQELSDSIFVHGLKEPLTLDILTNGDAYIEMGHRRYKAMQLLVEKGKDGWSEETMIEFFSNKSDVTELDRMINQYTSNNNKKKLKPFEAAAVAYEAKFNFSEKPKSNEEIAELLGVSRQQIDNYITIATASDELKNQMVLADMNLTDCLALLKSKKKLDKQTDKVEEDSHKKSAPPTPLPKDILKEELDELKELDAQVEQMKQYGEIDEENEEVRITNPELKKHESKGLSLIGNTIANNSKEKLEDDGVVKYDSDRPEIAQIQNIIKLADKIEAVVNKLDCPEGTKTDITNYVKWLQKDAAEVREWIHKNKKQNKIR